MQVIANDDGVRVWVRKLAAIAVAFLVALSMIAVASPAAASHWGTCAKAIGIQRIQCHGNLLHNFWHTGQAIVYAGSTYHDKDGATDPAHTVSIWSATSSNVSGYHAGRYFLCSDSWAGACH